MELASTRKLLSWLFAFIIALGSAAVITALTAGSTLASSECFQKNAVTPAVVSECEKQLDAKFSVLAEESGIPKSVFLTVTNEYPVDGSMKTAFQNVFSNDNPELYTNELVNHFEQLCTDYLDGNEIKYNKKHVKTAAQEAAKIFSQTVGLHNMGATGDKIQRLKDFSSKLIVTGLAAALLGAGFTLLLYSNKKKALVYIYSGISGGAAGTALGGIICRLHSPAGAVNVIPKAYNSIVSTLFAKSFTTLALASLAVAALFWIIMLLTYRQQRKKRK